MMDKKLLDALNNLSLALSEISDALKKDDKAKKSATTQALQGGNFIKEIKEINIGVKALQRDTKAILKNQQTIIELSKSRGDNKSTFEKVGGSKKQENDIKKGVGTILLIAVAVLAIGMAFKLVGGINFLSVIGLSIAMFILAQTFEKIGALKLTMKQALVASATMVLISIAVTLSSWVLQAIQPITFPQAVTGILIAGMFLVISYNLDKIAKGVAAFDKANVKPSDLLMCLVGVAVAITLSSWALAFIVPMTLGQAITGILISAMFMIISYNLDKIAMGVVAFDKANVKPKDLLMCLVGIAVAITASSWVLSLIKPLDLPTFITALGIALLFGLMSYVMPEMAIGIVIMDKTIGSKKMLAVVPLVFVAISLAIMLSSHILAMSKPIEFGLLLKIAVFGVVLGLCLLAVLPAVLGVGIVAASGVGMAAIGLGVIAIPLIAGAIAISSNILAMGTYKKYPGLGWAVSVGLTMIGFGAAVLALGTIAVTGIGAVAIVAGALLVPLIAKSIVDSDDIISKGKYDKYPGLGWVLSVGSTMLGFGLAVVALGALAVTGIGAVAIFVGTKMIPMVAQSIVDVDRIISKGKYDKYPGWEWALSVGGLMTGFGLAVITLGTYVVGTLGLGGLAIKAGANAVRTIAHSIVDVAWIFKASSNAFTGGPKKEWAEGVSLAIGAFAPIYKMMMRGGIVSLFMGSGPSVGAFTDAIRTISQGIVDAALFFQAGKVAFTGGPSKEWAEGVGNAIGAFAPVYKILSDESGIFGTGVGIEEFKNAIMTISHGIVASAGIFAMSKVGFNEGTYPTKEWSVGVGNALSAFSPVFKALSGKGWFESGKEAIGDMVYGVKQMAYAIVKVGRIFSLSKVNWDPKNMPDKNWGVSVLNSFKYFSRLQNMVADSDVGFLNRDLIIKSAKGMVNFAKELQKGVDAFQIKIDPNFMKNMSSNIYYYMTLANKLNSGNGLKSLVKGAVFGDPMTNIASSMTKLAIAYDKMGNSLMKFNKAVNSLDEKKISAFKGLNSNMINRVIKNSDSNVNNTNPNASNIGLVGGAIGNLTSIAVPGDKRKDGGKKESRGKHGTTNEQNDKMIDLLYKLIHNTGYLDKYLKEKLNGDDGNNTY